MHRSCYGAASAGCNWAAARRGESRSCPCASSARHVPNNSGVGRRPRALEAEPTPVCPRRHGRARATHATLFELQPKNPNVAETIPSATLPQSRAWRLGVNSERTQGATERRRVNVAQGCRQFLGRLTSSGCCLIAYGRRVRNTRTRLTVPNTP
ncbi:hypothetical protein VTO73DRAFT_2631 [Trametes versicolor]